MSGEFPAMFSFFLRAFIFLTGLWVLRRLLGTIFGEPPKKSQPKQRETSKSSAKMVRDPVCGMYMDPRLAVRVDDKKGTFYFCSEECRRKYVA